MLVLYITDCWHHGFHYKLHSLAGKKQNVLRGRVEPSEYQLDQLLIGAILFTLAAFLFPTVLAYYLVFATSRIAIIALYASLESTLAFLNHFPLFAVMLRFKDPQRLPGGLDFRCVEVSLSPSTSPPADAGNEQYAQQVLVVQVRHGS